MKKLLMGLTFGLALNSVYGKEPVNNEILYLKKTEIKAINDSLSKTKELVDKVIQLMQELEFETDKNGVIEGFFATEIQTKNPKAYSVKIQFFDQSGIPQTFTVIKKDFDEATKKEILKIFKEYNTESGVFFIDGTLDGLEGGTMSYEKFPPTKNTTKLNIEESDNEEYEKILKDLIRMILYHVELKLKKLEQP